MFNKFFFISLLITSSLAKCFTNYDIINSNVLFTYKNNVYDITGFSHPGGKSNLKKTIGKDLEPFIKNPKYKFHLNKDEFYKDLEKIYIGTLCNTTTPTNIVTNTTTTIPSNIITNTTTPTNIVTNTTTTIPSDIIIEKIGINSDAERTYIPTGFMIFNLCLIFMFYSNF
jgi:hypothetical protein